MSNLYYLILPNTVNQFNLAAIKVSVFKAVNIDTNNVSVLGPLAI